MIASDGSGVSAARNAGARAARGDWLLFLDSDDRLRPHAIRTLIEAAAGQPGVLLSYGDYRRIDERGAPIGSRRWLGFRRKPTGDVLRQLLTGNFIVTGAAVVQARAFRDLGGFSERLRYAEDWHLWCRLAAHGDCEPNRVSHSRLPHASQEHHASARA